MPHHRTVPTRLRQLLLIVAVLGGTVGAWPAGAQEPGPVTFGVTPSSATGPDGRSAFTFDAEPGDVIEDYVGISNLSEAPLELAVYASDAFTTAEGGFDLLPAAEAPTDVGAWVGFADETVTVPARSRLDVPFRLTIPANATPGDHPGGIVASLRTPGDGGQVSVDRRVGARIYLRVAGALDPSLEVTGVDLSYRQNVHPVGRGAATITYTVANTGNTRLTGSVRVRVAGPFGAGSTTVDLDDLPEILPGARLTRTTTIDDVLPLVRTRATVTVEPLPVGADRPLPPVARSTTTWSPPLTQLAAAALILGLLLVARRRRRNRERQHAAELADARRGAVAAAGATTSTPLERAEP